MRVVPESLYAWSVRFTRLWSYDRALSVSIWLMLAISLTMWLVAVAMILGRLR
jgi:hypothetical protein